ncbi:MAG: radical SAM protein [Bryobacteraceae bacterium]|nr:radical SAM protein [Bryobacteraceae bacterium]
MGPALPVRIRRKLRGAGRRWREARMFARAMASPRHPIVVHLIPIRRCNLACAYCNEYDDFSPPVPLETLQRRVDLLASLGTTIITLSGGEPLLHPELDALIRHIRRRGILATVITNGYLLTPERIRRLNHAGLDYLQISIDNLRPDNISMKSLKVLDQKLRWLAAHAEFAVTINSVLGGGMPNPEDALAIARRARELGFTATVGLLHAPGGHVQPLTAREREVYEQILELGKSLYSFAHYDRFQKNLVRGLPNEWHCRAGSRYLYVCEDGLVHWCSQQRGYPGIPLEEYTRAHLEREYRTVKPCAPYCTVSCVHQTAMVDWFREHPREALTQLVHSVGARSPSSARLLAWLLLDTRNRRLFQKLALRVLGIERRAA